MNYRIAGSCFSPTDTQVAKGVAVLLLLWHHLFGFSERLPIGGYVSFTPFLAVPMELRIAIFAKVCVSIFLFLSGYGLWINYGSGREYTFQEALKRISIILRKYWLVILLILPIGMIFYSGNEQYVWSLKEFFLNITTLSSSYCYEWWFICLYIQILLTLSIIVFLVRKIGIMHVCIISVSLFYLTCHMPRFHELNLHFSLIKSFMYWQVSFVMGIFFAEKRMFKTLQVVFGENPKKLTLFSVIVITFLLMPWLGGHRLSPFITPLIIWTSVSIVNACHLRKPLAYIGRQSLYIWLLHPFFCFYFLPELTYAPRFSVLIFVWLLFLSIVAALAVQLLEKEIIRLIMFILKKVRCIVYARGGANI